MTSLLSSFTWREQLSFWFAVLMLCIGISRSAGGTVLEADGARFVVNGRPTFLVGVSYYGALGAPRDFVRRDLDDIRRGGFNWVRIWATWAAFGTDVSAVSANGLAREPFLNGLKWLVSECDRRGLVVDVTLTRGSATAGAAGGCVTNLEAHLRAAETLVLTLKTKRNWYLDLANEHDVRDARFVSAGELKKLREAVRRLDPNRLVTASFGGHDLTEGDVRESLLELGMNFLAPHRPREPGSPSETESKTRGLLGVMGRLGHTAPVLYQEPFRRGYPPWEPVAEDFLADLRGAIDGGAAGWCLHNGAQSGAADRQPRRSFDLRAKRLFEQLDAEELKAIGSIRGIVAVRASER